MKNIKNPVNIPGIRNITISGRIGTGKSTLAINLAEYLGWNLLDGGKIFRKYAKEYGFHIMHKDKIPDDFDRNFEEKTKQILEKENNYIVQTHLAGFLAQGIDGVYKILVTCEDENKDDKQAIRIDRLMNRDLISAKEAKLEIKQREVKLLDKFKKLYVPDDKTWVYWNPAYYDLSVNTFNLNQKEATLYVLKHLGIDV